MGSWSPATWWRNEGLTKYEVLEPQNRSTFWGGSIFVFWWGTYNDCSFRKTLYSWLKFFQKNPSPIRGNQICERWILHCAKFLRSNTYRESSLQNRTYPTYTFWINFFLAFLQIWTHLGVSCEPGSCLDVTCVGLAERKRKHPGERPSQSRTATVGPQIRDDVTLLNAVVGVNQCEKSENLQKRPWKLPNIKFPFGIWSQTQS